MSKTRIPRAMTGRADTRFDDRRTLAAINAPLGVPITPEFRALHPTRAILLDVARTSEAPCAALCAIAHWWPELDESDRDAALDFVDKLRRQRRALRAAPVVPTLALVHRADSPASAAKARAARGVSPRPDAK